MIWRITKRLLGRPESVLDASCGRGDFALSLSRQIPVVAGCDISEAMIAVAGSLAPGLRFEVADFRSLPFADGEFDAVTCVYAFHHILPQDRAQVLSELARVCRNRVVVEFKNRRSLYYRGSKTLHFSGITTHLTDLNEIQSGFDGFSLERVRGIFGPLVLSPWAVASFTRTG